MGHFNLNISTFCQKRRRDQHIKLTWWL